MKSINPYANIRLWRICKLNFSQFSLDFKHFWPLLLRLVQKNCSLISHILLLVCHLLNWNSLKHSTVQLLENRGFDQQNKFSGLFEQKSSFRAGLKQLGKIDWHMNQHPNNGLRRAFGVIMGKECFLQVMCRALYRGVVWSKLSQSGASSFYLHSIEALNGAHFFVIGSVYLIKTAFFGLFE